MRKANPIPNRMAAEAAGTMFLLIGTTGAGIAGMDLFGGSNSATQLAVSLSAAAMLFVWISVFAEISGAHFNPAVTLAFCISGESNVREGIFYVGSQIAGGAAGVMAANVMFGLPALQAGAISRSGSSQWFSEALITFGLVLVILLLQRRRPSLIAAAVAAYIFAGHWCSVSGAFANPAVTIARGMTGSFTGIEPADIPAFVAVQIAGGITAVFAARMFTANKA